MKPGILLLATIILLLAGCGSPPPTATPTATLTPSGTPTLTPDANATATQAALAAALTDLPRLATAQAEAAQATLDAVHTLNAVFNATNVAVSNNLYTVAAALGVTATELNRAIATMTEAARPTATPTVTDTPTPTITPTPPLTPTAIPWRAVEVPTLGLRLGVPGSLAGPQVMDSQTVTFGSMEGVALLGITVERASIDDLLGSEAALAGQDDPVRALEAILSDVADSPMAVTITGEAEAADRLDYPAAQARLSISDLSAEMALYLLRLGENDWLMLTFYGQPDAVDAWAGRVVRGMEVIGPPGTAPTRPPEAIHATLTPTPQPAEPTGEAVAPGVALGLNFALPEGWQLREWPGEPGIDAPGVALLPPEPDEERRGITLVRGSAAQVPAATRPADPGSPAEILAQNTDLIRQTLNFATIGRANEFQLGSFAGAWVSLRGETVRGRLYLFRAGPDDWILIYAEAASRAFNAFTRAELHDFLASLALAEGPQTALSVEPTGPVEEAVVTHVSDGDTLHVLLNGVEERVRIIGVDAPEAHHPDSGADWLGYAATHAMARLAPVGRTVYLESDLRDRDDYGRLLRYLWVRDGAGGWIMVEAELLRAGMARVRTYDERRYVPYFLTLEREAQRAELGIWGGPPPPPPTDPIASKDDRVWVINPDGDAAPLLYDAAALGVVPDPIAIWPNHVSAVVSDVYYVYPDDIDPVTGRPVDAGEVGYWYWLAINDFRGWVPERWLLLGEPEWTYPGPETDIVAYAEPFVVGQGPVEVLAEPGLGIIVGHLPPGSRAQVTRLGIDPLTGDWWMYVDTPGPDGWVPVANLSRSRPENG